MKHRRNTSQKLTLEDIRENILIIKINKSFREGMSEVRETIPYNETTDAGRIVFKGRNADEEIRKKYLDYSVAGLFKRGEAAPVKVILKSQG